MRYGKRTKPRRRLRVRPQRLMCVCVLAITLFGLASWFTSGTETPPQEPEVFETAAPEILSAHTEAPSSQKPENTPEPTITPDPWTQEELQALARTLSGECYDDKPEDKRKVCEVILNRVSAGRFGDGIVAVVTAKSQFIGYWNPSRSISANDLEVAERALRDWYAGNCEPLSDYLFFVAGPNRENVFRVNY